MTRQFLLALLSLAGCQCFVPVDECPGDCPDGSVHTGRDAGRVDAGDLDAGQDPGADAGRDAGTVDAGPPHDAGVCDVWAGGGVGACDAITGYLFHGTVCAGACVVRPITTPGVFPDLATCVRCGCNPTRLTVVPPLGVPVNPNSYCDDLFVFTSDTREVEDAFPGFDLSTCKPAEGVTQCPLWRRQLGEEGYARACAATLLPAVREVRCVVYTP